MTIYKVMNANNVAKSVSDEDLDRAALDQGPLATELANAAARAKCTALAPRLIQTLAVGPRLQRMAAARALLAVDHLEAVAALEMHAATEPDPATAQLFRVIALRMRGVADLRRTWQTSDDSELCNSIPALYNGPFTLTPDDVELMLDILTSYLDKTPGWIAALSTDDWRDDVYTVVYRLCDESQPIMRRLSAETATRLRHVFERIASSPADRDTKLAVKRALSTF